MPEVISIIVAAGTGSRFGGDTPKQFLELDGIPVCVVAARHISQAVPGCMTIYVLPEHNYDYWEQFISGFVRAGENVRIVPGGKTRWQSVKNALDSIRTSAMKSAVVLVHDGARPLVEEITVKNVVQATLNTDGAVPVVPVTDSLRRIGEDGITSEPVDRSEYRSVQTPQGSTFWRMSYAYSQPYDDSFTDDASVLAGAGFSNIVLVKGSPRNIKITNPDDLKIAKCLI